MNKNISIPDWLPSSVAALQSFLKVNPEAEHKVSEMLDTPLAKIDANTSATVIASLDGYFGTEITDMLFDVVQPELGSHLQEFGEVIPKDALDFLKKFITKYGSKLAGLAQASNQFSATVLDTFLKTHPQAEQQVREILDKRLDKLDATTWSGVVLNLDNYWGKESTNILIDIAQFNQASRLQEVKESASPEVTDFLRKIISTYGPELADAYLASNQLPNSWKTFYRDVYYDYVNKRPLIRVRLAKYNGEEPFVEGTADSILELAIFIMETLRFLPSSNFIGKAMAERFIQETNDFMKFLQPPPSDESADKPESKPSKP